MKDTFWKRSQNHPKSVFWNSCTNFIFFKIIASLFFKKKWLSHPCSYTKSTNLGPQKPSNGFANPKPISHTTLSNIYPLRHRICGIPRLYLVTATARDGGAILVFGRRVERSIQTSSGFVNLFIILISILSNLQFKSASFC